MIFPQNSTDRLQDILLCLPIPIPIPITIPIPIPMPLNPSHRQVALNYLITNDGTKTKLGQSLHIILVSPCITPSWMIELMYLEQEGKHLLL